jgi:hypothetical protein
MSCGDTFATKPGPEKVPSLSSITAIAVARENPSRIEGLTHLSNVLAETFVDVEIVVVVNGVSSEASLRLKRFCEQLPDCTMVFLTEEVHDDIARLIGIDHAISDFILFCTPIEAEIKAIPSLIELLQRGYDLVIGEGRGGISVERGYFSRILFQTFRWLFRATTGVPYQFRPPMFRAFSRSAALYIATRHNGDVLVRASDLGQGFPATTVTLPDCAQMPGRGMPISMGIAKALRLLLTGSARPLRFTSYLGLAGGTASAIYALYVIAIFLLKANVEPGWTTLSLQTAGMMFLFSIQFLFLSEYLIQILSAAPAHSRRHLVARELRSQFSRRSGRLNVVGSDGQFHLGAPERLVFSGGR